VANPCEKAMRREQKILQNLLTRRAGLSIIGAMDDSNGLRKPWGALLVAKNSSFYTKPSTTTFFGFFQYLMVFEQE
jgi:hypothetical protein